MEKEKTREEQVKEARQELKQKGIGNWIKEQLISEWKPTKQNPLQPIKATWTFTKWVSIFYIIFVTIQAINFSLIHCESNVIPNNTYINARLQLNEYMKEKNKQCTNQYGFQTENNNKTINCNEQIKITCKYNLQKTEQQTVGELTKTIKNNIKYKVPLWN